MTTIALKDGVLAIDSQVTVMDTITFKPKMYYCEGLGAVAVCGCMTNAENIARWLFRGCTGFKPGTDWCAYYLTTGGKCFMVHSDSTLVRCGEMEFDGCGSQMAHALMHVGHNAIEAVHVVSELCPHTGGETTYYDSRSNTLGGNAQTILANDLDPIETQLPNFDSGE